MVHTLRRPLMRLIPLWAIALTAIAPPERSTVAQAQEGSAITLKSRSDAVPDKLRQLSEAYAEQDYDLAMSLAESIKDTLSLQRQLEQPISPPRIAADHFEPTTNLPASWASWSSGWSYCKPLTVVETVGISRKAEPIDVSVGFRDDQVTDPHREVRVARVDRQKHTLHEVTSQVYQEIYREGQRICRIVFLANAGPNERADYLIFYGNPNAERPAYATDLKVHGEGQGLDIENNHFLARLSRQMGQLERLTYKRQHSLELFAGGKGHGEPPGIDWAHDYVDAGHFQKFRIRNWSACPNYEVVKGPLCVRVRRWGFPHSPVHPLFTPSRIHMDHTYVFYAGLPYFFKEGRFDVIKELEIEASRDDEWVFSGYSFTDKLWMDHDGKLHEGDVPEDQQEDLWGVGFYNRTSRDAFMALWLDHSSENFDGIRHGGEPTLHYNGHGQLWSRYPAESARLQAGASIRQRNAYVVAPYPAEGGAEELEKLRRRLLHPLAVVGQPLSPITDAQSSGALAREGETNETAPLKPALWRTLREVRDDQLYKVDANVVDMGYVYDVSVRDGVVEVLVTMPHRGRPVFEFLVTQGGGRVDDGIYERLMRVDGVQDVVVKFTWEPAWTIARLTKSGRRTLGIE
jgi:metal-sulfur cluster biosynthetic enzyme